MGGAPAVHTLMHVMSRVTLATGVFKRQHRSKEIEHHKTGTHQLAL